MKRSLFIFTLLIGLNIISGCINASCSFREVSGPVMLNSPVMAEDHLAPMDFFSAHVRRSEKKEEAATGYTGKTIYYEKLSEDSIKNSARTAFAGQANRAILGITYDVHIKYNHFAGSYHHGGNIVRQRAGIHVSGQTFEIIEPADSDDVISNQIQVIP